MSTVRTRFAPSPTGDLHVGGAWTALASWAYARAARGTTILRVEDIDTPRVVRGSAAAIEEDLAWLGLDWDEGPATGGPFAPYLQSHRTTLYEAALSTLDAAGLTYPCDCSRAEIARVASAPHEGDEILYPGTCRTAPRDRELKRPPAIRLRVPEGTSIAFDDLLRGRIEQRVDHAAGDFVLRRGDGVFAYQLVAAVDDAGMQLSHVIRGVDLLASTPRQILLMQMLGVSEAAIPKYAHVPLVVGADGARLAKRTRGSIIRDLRERLALTPEEIVATLAVGLGLVSVDAPRGGRMGIDDVARAMLPPAQWRRDAWSFPVAWT